MTKREILEALAEAFTLPFDYARRNPDYDKSKGWTDDNEMYIDIPLTMDERIARGSTMIHFTAEDGYGSMRMASFEEIADATLRSNNDQQPKADNGGREG